MSKESKRREALVYHAKPKPGKLEVNPSKPYASQRDLSLAYSPGVAEPCLEIEKETGNVYKYTNKANLVAVISNGTAVLGLGDIGPEASKPVMEGKGLLFKIFAGIDVFDIEVDTKDVDAFVATVKNIAPTFGGINLEDIKAPEAFEIERRLVEELNIPVMHDDQHGTAIISGAALLNAVELAEKEMSKVKMVISGAGAAAISCARLYRALGVSPDNMMMTDSKGIIRADRENLTAQKAEFATKIDAHTLDEALVDADVFIGLSKADIMTAAMLKSMAPDPIVFAMANPNPEIDYNLAVATRNDTIMATGRSDFPNQVNNVLGFPFIFRGALDVRATKINEAMKMAAVHALAHLAKETVPEQVNIAYGATKLAFGKDYIIPKPFDPRLITTVPMAVARAAMESGVAAAPIKDWDKYQEELHTRTGSDKKLVRLITSQAKSDLQRVVFAEGDELDVLKAAQLVHEEGIAIPILLGDEQYIREMMATIEFEGDVTIIDPKKETVKESRDAYAHTYWQLRQRKGITLYDAQRRMRERNYYAAMMVREGDADAMISGYSRSYPNVLKPVLQVIDTQEGVNRVATTNLMITNRGPLFISDTSININPNAKDLAKIAQMTSYTAALFGIQPKVAMLSYSNFGSSKNEDAQKVSEAVKLAHRFLPDIAVDGPIQADFALNKTMLTNKFPFSKIAGAAVNTLVLPDLNAANIAYKLIKELDNALSIGPIMMGLKHPVHILQLGASVDEIVHMTAVAAVDAQNKKI
ncbi:MAG: NADP-dependent malic enzyme [Flavobacteriaceae bacterium]|jgi:malate dehydrogenase (oxaloacetate-decarboxylating)(NADP+)|nr:NADP-dependent malic enzyme [Flavobacteriaceae bacterium]MDG2290883.1 NADP-dependent malic enzyme [Flavobacteriaceae bacterium]